MRKVGIKPTGVCRPTRLAGGCAPINKGRTGGAASASVGDGSYNGVRPALGVQFGVAKALSRVSFVMA